VTDDTISRHSIRYFPSREGSHPQGHAFLLARDIPLGILPIRGGRDHASFDVTLTPADDGRVSSLIRLLHIGRSNRRTLEEAFVDFVDTAALYIAYHGEVLLEILMDEDGSPVELDPLPPGRVARTPRAYLQLVPKPDRQHVGKAYARIPKENVWRLGLPKELGSGRQHRRLLRRLEALSEPMPRFALESLDMGRASAYDFSAHRRACDRLMERATKRWGSVPSLQRPVEGSTEYFFIARRLAFRRAQALLREHVTSELNSFLARLGLDDRVVVSGIPTASEIDATLEGLQRGDATFAEALDSTKT
jgi:hypothetical protein